MPKNDMRFPKDATKAIELYLRSDELGFSESYYSLGVLYELGNGLERDMKEAKQYYQSEAIGGSIMARHNLGCLEGNAGNHERASNHFLIVKSVKRCFKMTLLEKTNMQRP